MNRGENGGPRDRRLGRLFVDLNEEEKTMAALRPQPALSSLGGEYAVAFDDRPFAIGFRRQFGIEEGEALCDA